MTEATQVPLYYAREGFGPTPEVTKLRESGGLTKVRVTKGSGTAGDLLLGHVPSWDHGFGCFAVPAWPGR